MPSATIDDVLAARWQSNSLVVLRDVSWTNYTELRALEEADRISMTYSCGELACRAPTLPYQGISRLLGMFVANWMARRGVHGSFCGSATLQNEALKIGLEPDESFYFSRSETDSTKGPLPDLAIEVDVTSLTALKLPLYAKLGLREVWVSRDELCVHLLSGRAYVAAPESTALPGFPIGPVAGLLSEADQEWHTALFDRFNKLIGPQT